MSVTPELSVAFTSGNPGPTRISFGTAPSNGDLVIVFDSDFTGLLADHWTGMVNAVITYLEGEGASDVTSDTIEVTG